MKLLIINGPNLNLLGLREPEIYGKQDYAALCRFVLDACAEAGVEGELFQSNVDRIQAAYGVFDGIVINPAAYTHTSVAILDALKAVAIPVVEVHPRTSMRASRSAMCPTRGSPASKASSGSASRATGRRSCI